MRYITILLAGFAFLIACNTSCSVKENVQWPDNLETTQYVINTDRDTTIETKNGALLKIPKGALVADDGNNVTLDIKEAYSISQMILAGLTTASNGDPLSSGGMIYINPAKGQHVAIKGQIQVAIPADFLQKGMQLYKGEKTAGGRINWKDPDPLPENKQEAFADTGKMLFERKCATCHAIGKDMTGPDLAQFMKRFPLIQENEKYYQAHLLLGQGDAEEEIYRERKIDTQYYRKDAISYYHPDLYSCNLKEMYGSTGTLYDFTPDQAKQVLSIYRYIQNESDRLSLPLPHHAYLKDCVDSCDLYTKRTQALIERKQEVQENRERLVNENGPLVDKHPDTTWGVTTILPPDFDQRVSPKYYDANYYQFKITSFGWYNIDILMKGIDGAVQSELYANVVGNYTEKIKIYLIIPSVKVYGEGGSADRNPEEFTFFYKNGQLPLPQNVPAYILAVTETQGSIAYGLKQFTTTTSQNISIELHASSKEEFTAAMKQFDINHLHITVADAKNAKEIRITDTVIQKIDEELKEAENLKPKRCDCNCNGNAK